MSTHSRTRGWLVALLCWSAAGWAVPALAAPWSALPEAVDRLHQQPGDRAAQRVLQDAEESLLAEAAAGRLEVVLGLMDAYQSLVTPLHDGDRRCDDLRARAARVLVQVGDARLPGEPDVAGRAWTVAAALDPSSGAPAQLRGALLPPPVAAPGAVWRSPIDGAELVFHPPLRFRLGCTVGDNDCLKDEFGRLVRAAEAWIEWTEVTNRRYLACVQAGVCRPPEESGAFGEPNRADEPVVGVTWTDANAYARWAGRRLPSEVEWERAARGTADGGRFPWGKGRERGRANLEGIGEEDQFKGIAPVASFPATGYGLHDLAGNAWEWCADRYHRDLSGGPASERPWDEGGWGRVLRGGSWRRTIEVARVSTRMWLEEGDAGDDVGFRTVADVPDRVTDDRLIELASAAFPPRTSFGTELASSGLTEADRRYLERMSVTWLVLEGRLEEAAPRVVALVRGDPRDPVALDLLGRVEQEMSAELQRGGVARTQTALAGYRSAARGDRQLDRRLADHERRLLDELRVRFEAYVADGDPATVIATVGLARMLDPSEDVLQALATSDARTPGLVRVWPRDQREMAWIPPGGFRMGASAGDTAALYDEHPAHSVSVGGFWLDSTEVSNDDYRRCVADGGCSPPHRTLAFDNPAMGAEPVLWVDWFQAKRYAAWAGKRLPTEVEWEYAARSMTSTRFPWGDDWRDGELNALGTGGRDRWSGLAPVGSFAANPWGVYDLLGNASEWVQDVYHRNYWDAPADARAWTQLSGGQVERQRVVRGGAYLAPGLRQRVSIRDSRSPETFSRTTGFRCAADP